MVFTINRNAKNVAMHALKKIILFLLLILVASIAFSMSFNQMRVRTFVKDAMTVRANTILANTDTKKMSNFFDENFITTDEMMVARPYALYDVSGYDYKMEIDHLSVGWIAPRKANVIVEEYVTDITGQFAGTAEEKIGMTDFPPEWQSARYRVTLKKSEGRWYIVDIEKVKDLK